jgi:hypothetical protein
MKIAKIVLAGFAALTLFSSVTLVTSVTLAQQTTTGTATVTTGTGTVTTIDRIRGSIGIRPTQEGTVGANTGGADTQFKLQGGSLDALHAGDRVTFSATETGGVKSITKIDRQ